MIMLKPMEMLKPAVKENAIQKDMTMLKSQQVQSQSIVQKQMQKQMQKQSMFLKTPQKFTTPPAPRIPTRPYVPTPLIKLGGEKKPFTIIRRKSAGKLFIPEVRRRGKFAPISRPVPIATAIGLGKAKVRGTLGASLRIRQAGTNEFVALAPTEEFRMAKKQPFTIVQRQRARLSSLGERKEIVSSRRIRW
jgi:hypothetical protein